MESIKVTLVGTTPLIMHNSRLADPLDEYAKRLSVIAKKKSKTDADHEHLARIEWEGGLYTNKDGCPIVPGFCIKASLVNAAKLTKKGKDFKAGIASVTDGVLEERDIRQAFDDKNYIYRVSVVVMGRRCIRTRPIFNNWKVTVTIMFDELILKESEVRDALVAAGNRVGLLERRPEFGSFEVE